MFEIFIMKTSKITPKGKFKAKCKNFCTLLYLCDVYPWAHFDSNLLRPVVDFLLPMDSMGSFTTTNFRRSRLGSMDDNQI